MDPLKYDQLADEKQPLLQVEWASRPVPSSAYAPVGRVRGVVPEPTSWPSRYMAWPGTSTAWCQAPLLTAAGEVKAWPKLRAGGKLLGAVAVVLSPFRWPSLPIHSTGTWVSEKHPEAQSVGRMSVTPSRIP